MRNILNLKNKKGSSMAFWIEAIIFVGLFISVGSIVTGNFNIMYNKTNDVGFGLNSTESALASYQKKVTDTTDGGEVELNQATGLTLKGIWGIMKDGSKLVWNFFSGGFIESAVSMVGLPSIVATYLRFLYFISIGLIIIYLFMKVRF